MTIIDTKREDIRNLKGAHLFHFATSNCSQRVRFVLEEKHVPWVSHHIDLLRCENATPEFVALNPKGVVPVFVHDGRTIVESNDIIQYIDEHFEGPALTPVRGADREFLRDSLELSSAFQASLKLLTHEFLFKPARRMNASKLQAYSEGTKSAELTEFMREFSSVEGFSHDRIVGAVNDVEEVLRILQIRLESHQWLTGDNFGLTDISWVVNVYRFRIMGYPLERFNLVMDWLHRIRSRPAFARAITRFESKKVMLLFSMYSFARRIQRTSIRQYIPDCSAL